MGQPRPFDEGTKDPSLPPASAEFGGLDIAFNNAGVFAELSPIAEQAEDEFDLVMDSNVKGVWLSLKYELRQMVKQGRGAIVNNAAVGGLIGSGGGAAPYCASKHAVIGLTKCAKTLENAKAGARVNAVCPAVIDTSMGAQFARDLGITMEQFGEAHPVGRVGRSEEVATAVVFLCSEQSSFITGASFTIDGGLTAQ